MRYRLSLKFIIIGCCLLGLAFVETYVVVQKVLAQTGPSVSASIAAESQQGTNSWYITGVTVTLTGIPNGSAVKSITYRLDSGPWTTVEADVTTQTFSQNGNHTLQYYATNVNNVNGSTSSLPFKIDTVSPRNWTNFSGTRQGNDHTYLFSITVGDTTAGLDPTKTFIQYSLDGGQTFGFYSDLSKCNSTWNADSWLNLPTQSFASGATAGTLSTAPIDFCDSSGDDCYVIKFRVLDLASNTGEKKICLFGPWLQTQGGDVYSKTNIAMIAEGAQANASHLVGSSGTITSFTSNTNWYMPSYTTAVNLNKFTYPTLYPKVAAQAQVLPGGQLPKTNGYFHTNGDLTISSALLPANYSTTQNFGNIVFVNGDLFINTNFSLHASSAVVFVVNGTVNVTNTVTSIPGVYISSGVFDSSYNANGSAQLVVNGMLYSTAGFAFSRSLTPPATNNTTPAELIVYQPQYLLNTSLQKLLAGTIKYDWREVKP